MRSPKSYSVAEVLDSAIINLTLEFKTSKNLNFMGDDLNKALGKRVIATTDANKEPSWTTAILLQEYVAERSKYTLKVGPRNYNELNPSLRSLLMLVNESAALDRFTGMKVGLSFDHSKLKTLRTVSNMDVGKMVLKMNEEFVYQRFQDARNNPFSMSIKRVTPHSNFINSSTVIHSMDSVFKLPMSEHFGIDFTNYSRGEITFNYIRGKDYADKPAEIEEVLEYYVITTYQALNERDYTEFEERELGKITENYLKLKNLWYNSDRFLKEYEKLDVMVDLNNHPDKIKARWDHIRGPLFRILFETDIKEGKFNWDSEQGVFQIKNMTLNGTFLRDTELIKCKVNGCVLENVHCWGTEIANSKILTGTLVEQNTVKRSDLKNVRADRQNLIEESHVRNSGEMINCRVNDTVIRNAGIGRLAKINEGSTIIQLREFAPEMVKGVDVEEIRDYRWLKELTERQNDATEYGNQYKTDYD